MRRAGRCRGKRVSVQDLCCALEVELQALAVSQQLKLCTTCARTASLHHWLVCVRVCTISVYISKVGGPHTCEFAF